MPDFVPPKARPIVDIYADFREPIPSRFISQKDTGRFKADYVHHAVLRDLLDYYAPGWEWSTRLESIKDTIYCIGTLTIHGTDVDGHSVRVSRDGMGNENDEVSGYGDPSSNSEAQALRRACMAHGLGRHLWKK